MQMTLNGIFCCLPNLYFIKIMNENRLQTLQWSSEMYFNVNKFSSCVWENGVQQVGNLILIKFSNQK